MGYRVHTLQFNIGDSGVTQSNDGSGGTDVTFEVNLVPPFGFTILNLALIQTDIGNLTFGPTIYPPSPDGTSPWHIYLTSHAAGTPYPVDDGTLALSVTVIMGD
jgi:hypothetical protein